MALSAKQALNVTNITYSWLPSDLDTSRDGEHNGKNYVAYTFYCKNEGEAEVDYEATLDISGVSNLGAFSGGDIDTTVTALSADETDVSKGVKVFVYLDSQDKNCFSDKVKTINAQQIIDSIKVDFTLA